MSGAQLETYIDRVNASMRKQQLAMVFKVPTPMRIQKRLGGGKVLARLDKVVWSDYAGTYYDGRAVAGEAKELRKTGNLTKARLATHQRECLGYTAESGGIAWIWVRRILNNAVTNDYIIPVTSREQLDSVIKLDAKYDRPNGLQWYHVADVWEQYKEHGWDAIKEGK